MTFDPGSQSEFLFTLHIFKICTCTQLRYHWIERGIHWEYSARKQ